MPGQCVQCTQVLCGIVLDPYGFLFAASNLSNPTYHLRCTKDTYPLPTYTHTPRQCESYASGLYAKMNRDKSTATFHGA